MEKKTKLTMHNPLENKARKKPPIGKYLMKQVPLFHNLSFPFIHQTDAGWNEFLFIYTLTSKLWLPKLDSTRGE